MTADQLKAKITEYKDAADACVSKKDSQGNWGCDVNRSLAELVLKQRSVIKSITWDSWKNSDFEGVELFDVLRGSY